MPSILDAKNSPEMFGPYFRGGSWAAWDAFLAALFALPPTPNQVATYQRFTKRTAWPTSPAREAWLACGRRAGKSRISALAAVYLACFRDYAAVLAPGEVGTVAVIAADRRQARTIFRYVKGLLEHPSLASLVESETDESIRLTNRVVIEVHTASYRS